MKYIILIVIVSLASCSSKNDFEKGKKQLEQQGYFNIQNTGYEMFCCSDSDSWSTGFTAQAKDSSTVKGCMCSGIGKGITIRYK